MVSKELLEKARKCSTKEELLELAKSENVEVSDDEINALLKSTATNRELSDDDLSKVTGGQSEIDLSTNKVLKNNTSEHYFMIKNDYGMDVGGISCWKYYDGSIDSNQNAILHKVDISIYYHNVDFSSLPDWVKDTFNIQY